MKYNFHVTIAWRALDGYNIGFWYGTDLRYDKKASYLTLELLNEIDNWVKERH